MLVEKSIDIIDIIGTPAILEQTAEEAVEVAKAALKLARFMRAENKVHGKTEEELYENLAEEMADVYICFDELQRSLIDREKVIDWEAAKIKRMAERLKEDGYL